MTQRYGVHFTSKMTFNYFQITSWDSYDTKLFAEKKTERTCVINIEFIVKLMPTCIFMAEKS